MKKKYSVLIIAICIVIITLISGLRLYLKYALNRKEIHSDHAVPYQIESHFGVSLPEHAHHLYYACTSFLFIDHFAAFTLQSQDECEAFLTDINYPLEKFEKSDTLPQRLIDNGPESWGEKYQDKNWQLSKEKSFMISGPKGGTINTVIYIPEKYRIYLVHWAE